MIDYAGEKKDIPSLFGMVYVQYWKDSNIELQYNATLCKNSVFASYIGNQLNLEELYCPDFSEYDFMAF